MTPESFIAHRERLGMSRAAFAEALGLAPNTITRYEKGRKPVPLTVRLAIAALLHGLPPANYVVCKADLYLTRYPIDD